MVTIACAHNSRCRYTNGYLCTDCGEFFSNESSVYRATELLTSLHMVLHNIRADYVRAGLETHKDVVSMLAKIGIGIVHEDYETLISEAEELISRYGKTVESLTVTLE